MDQDNCIRPREVRRREGHGGCPRIACGHCSHGGPNSSKTVPEIARNQPKLAIEDLTVPLALILTYCCSDKGVVCARGEKTQAATDVS